MNIRERETRLLNTVSNIMKELGDASIYSHVLHQTVRMHGAKLHHYEDPLGYCLCPKCVD